MNSIIVNIEHTVEEVNVILLALAERPFKEVNDLINKIRGSAMTQIGSQGLAAPASTEAPETTDDATADTVA